jgi:hypothetical protein
MTEWLKVHAWKACVGKLTVGSNPTLSANFQNSDFGRLLPRPARGGARLRQGF